MGFSGEKELESRSVDHVIILRLGGVVKIRVQSVRDRFHRLFTPVRCRGLQRSQPYFIVHWSKFIEREEVRGGRGDFDSDGERGERARERRSKKDGEREAGAERRRGKGRAGGVRAGMA